jgi:hypothetical protein
MVTVCNSSPVRCACEAFYDDRLIEKHLEKVHAALVNASNDTCAMDMSNVTCAMDMSPDA